CCARAASGQLAATPISVRNSRRLIRIFNIEGFPWSTSQFIHGAPFARDAANDRVGTREPAGGGRTFRLVRTMFAIPESKHQRREARCEKQTCRAAEERLLFDHLVGTAFCGRRRPGPPAR